MKLNKSFRSWFRQSKLQKGFGLIRSPQSVIRNRMREWVALNMTPGIGPRAAAKLLARFGSAEAVYRATRVELEQCRLLPEAVDSIIARDMHHRAEEEIENVRKLDGDVLVLDDGVYPAS